jgi:hypothetical protein
VTPNAPQPAAAEYRNPYVPGPKKSQPAVDRSAASAKVYYNPYVQQARVADSDVLARHDEQ